MFQFWLAFSGQKKRFAKVYFVELLCISLELGVEPGGMLTVRLLLKTEVLPHLHPFCKIQ